jgi:acetyl-CoA C-acetyltransferase
VSYSDFHCRFLVPRTLPSFGKFETIDALQYDGLWDMYNHCAMGICGEDTATKQGISRESQDAHCIESYKRAAAAWKSGAFTEEVAPVTVKGKKGEIVVTEDEEYKNASFEKIPKLRPAFKKDGGTITAANSSKLNDGASAVILMSESKAKELGLKPLAKIICKSLFWEGGGKVIYPRLRSFCRCWCHADRVPNRTYRCPS